MDSLAEFTLAEILELENIYKDIGQESLNAEFCRRLATSFSFSANRSGKPAITWEQVQSWFVDKHKEKHASFNPSSLDLNLSIDCSNASCLDNPTKIPHKSKGGKVTDLSELSFEAKSWRDDAWYDVAAFLNYRVLHTGELEARVRFVGFANTHDEWVNVKTAVRERSIPLEPSECHKVKVGDLVLCFRERQDHAIYCDAHVVGFQRRQHDTTDCTCAFMVRYEHDNAEVLANLLLLFVLYVAAFKQKKKKSIYKGIGSGDGISLDGKNHSSLWTKINSDVSVKGAHCRRDSVGGLGGDVDGM